MIPQPLIWQKDLGQLITDPLELLSLLELDSDDIDWDWDHQFPLRVTQSFVARMKKGDPHDPLLRQVLTTKQESQLSSCFSEDPLQESQYNPVPGLLHKYSSRVLLTVTQSCAIHCRFCFRRHFPYEKNNPGRQGWAPALNYIASQPQVLEVILSGGDPLMLRDEMLGELVAQLEAIPHIQFLRFHTRAPVVMPERITPALVELLQNTRFNTTMVYHINHPAEIIPAISDGVALLKQANVTVLNHTVLLKDINDNAQCLRALSISLFKAGILPYYVHLLDPVQGTSHFDSTLQTAKALQQHLRDTLPGYLVPQFVREVPHSLSKIPLAQLA
jgi:EF-P beta-lysylation protein EpmB